MRLMRFAPAHRNTTGRIGQGALGAALLGLAGLSGCSGSTSSEFSGDLFVRSCSIGCTDGSDGRVVTCQVVNVTENQEISILFSEPIDPTSITPSSLQVTNTANGTSPEGLRFVDPLDARRVIFRPSIAFESGGISFSFEANQTYEILIPGENQGDAGPFIRSTNGSPNRTRLQCSIETTEGIADIVPGNPQVTVEVDVATSFDANGLPLTTERRRLGSDPANFVSNISRFSKVYFSFNELMFLPTVADNASGQAPFIRVQFDRDGSLATAGSERIELPGSFELFVDQVALTTDLVFTPTGTIPSAGDDPLTPNLLVVRIPVEVTDAAGNPVTSATGGGLLAGVPEVIFFPEILIPEGGEDFSDTALRDPDGTGAVWEDGRLSPGISGGSGRLGELRVLAGETVTLNTDSQEFPLIPNISQIDVIGNGSGAAYPTTITVTDGVFEFSKLIVEPQARLVFEGSNPARVLVRGSCVISPNAVVDLAGSSAASHDSSVLNPDETVTAAAGGPGGGDGGFGADRSDLGTAVPNFATQLGVPPNPGADRNGRDGGGITGAAGTEGGGGPQFPNSLPAMFGTGLADLGGIGFNVAADPLSPTSEIGCLLQMVGNPGGGGAYSSDGSSGLALPVGDALTEAPAGLPVVLGAATPGGSTTSLNLAAPNAGNSGYDRRLLRWQFGHLVGGAGGGGGGNHPFASLVAPGGTFPPVTAANCLTDVGTFTFPTWSRWIDHSGASGGGGGGALELTMGNIFEFDGQIDLSGGDGGSATVVGTPGSFAAPGGGGAGGALRVRARLLDVSGNSRVDITGGLGGSAPWSINLAAMQTRGGAGSPGLVRMEDADNSGTVSFNALAARLLPFDSGNVTGSLDFLSYAPNFFDATSVGTLRPDSMSGATSCWMRPVGSFVSLAFPADAGTAVEDQGWTMDVVLDDGMGGSTLRPFRGVNVDFPTSWEDTFGNLLGFDLMVGESASPIVVRFQGARTVLEDLTDPMAGVDPCDLNITESLGGPVVLQSVTPWVSHPADLNQVLTGDGQEYTINMIRYCIIFDATVDGADAPGAILTGQGVLGVDNLRIRAQPE